MSEWNGIEILTSEEILKLTRTSAAHWWRECISDTDSPVDDDDICQLARDLNGISPAALLYAARAAGVYEA